MKLLRGDSQKPQSNDDCRVLAPYVMTLFDGEADEFEARRARAHLLVCQTCARRWLDWNRSRDLLCSAPVPAPPPHLLWRVLMACRLAASPKRAQSTAPRRTVASRTSTSRTAPHSEFPAELSARIFARTTRQALPAAFTPWPLRAVSALRMPALAVPALGVWMLILQRDVWLPAPVVPLLSIPTRAARASRSRNPQREASSASATRSPARGHAATPALSTPLPAAFPALASAGDDAMRFKAGSASRFALRGRRANSLETEPAIALASASASPAPGVASSPRLLIAGLDAQAEGALERALLLAAPPVAQDSAASLAIESSFPAQRSSRRRVAPSAEPSAAELSNPKRSPRLRESRFRVAPLLSLRHESGATNRTPRAEVFGAEVMPSPQLLRVSLPSARAPQPSRLLAENFDSDDDRLDEARSVVDDFRATLGSDDATDANADTAGDENSG